MITKRNDILSLTFVTIFLILLQSCNLDQVERKYSDFKTADSAGLFEKGWIPADLVFPSMSNIYQRTNLDLNTCIFYYDLTPTDLEKLKEKIKPSAVKYERLHRMKISSDWIKSINELNQYYFVRQNTNDTVYLAIDENIKRVYGWIK